MNGKQRAHLVGTNIARRRRELGMSQQKLCQLIGGERPVRQPYLSDWERGIHEPSAEYLSLIAEKLERPVAYFFTEHDGDPAEESAA